MKNAVVIRQAKTADLDAMGTLWQEFMDFHKERDPYFTRAADGHESFKKFVAGHIAAESSYVLVAEQEGNVVGYCLSALAKYPSAFENRDYGTVSDLAVTGECRGHGIGEKLYREAERWFGECEIHRIEVHVAMSNETSTSFWRKMGFDPYVTTVVKNIES